MERRTFVKSIGTGTAGIALAGCGGEESEATEVVDADGTTAAAEGTTAEAEETATETEAEETTAADEETTAADEETTSGEGVFGDVDGEVGESPDGLEVTNHELYERESAVGLQGTVENTGDQDYSYVEAEVTLQDDEGDVLYEFIDESEEADTASLPAGESWEFDVVFEEADDLSAVTAYTIDLEGTALGDATETETDDVYGDIDGEVDQQDPNLEITSHNLRREESTTYVTGTIENAGGEQIESVEVSVTLYDSEDNELFSFNNTVEEEEDISRLAPSESWDFRVQFEDIDMEEVARYVISADSDVI